jgi:AcrR family transcriptional regulator
VTETATTPTKLTMRDRHRLLTRDHITTAALEAFAERGYVATTVDDIVQRAGSACDLLPALRQQGRGAAGTAQHPDDGLVRRGCPRGGRAGGPPSGPSSRRWSTSTRPRRSYMALHQARAADPEFAAAHRATMEANVADWKRTDAIPGATAEQLRLAIAMMYTMVDSFMYLWLVDGWPLDRDAAIRAMTDALYATMR